MRCLGSSVGCAVRGILCWKLSVWSTLSKMRCVESSIGCEKCRVFCWKKSIEKWNPLLKSEVCGSLLDAWSPLLKVRCVESFIECEVCGVPLLDVRHVEFFCWKRGVCSLLL